MGTGFESEQTRDAIARGAAPDVIERLRAWDAWWERAVDAARVTDAEVSQRLGVPRML